MMIMHNDHLGMTNLDNVCHIEMAGLCILAYMVDGSHHRIGIYKNKDECQQAFDRLSSATKCK